MKSQKGVLRKAEEALPKRAEQLVVVFTDCGNKDNVPFPASVLPTLQRLARKLKSALVVIDAGECTADDRVRSLSGSLTSGAKDIRVQLGEFKRDSAHDQVYTSEIAVNGRILKLVVTVNGDFSMLFKRHCLEDHCVKLMGIPASGGAENAKQLA